MGYYDSFFRGLHHFMEIPLYVLSLPCWVSRAALRVSGCKNMEIPLYDLWDRYDSQWYSMNIIWVHQKTLTHARYARPSEDHLKPLLYIMRHPHSHPIKSPFFMVNRLTMVNPPWDKLTNVRLVRRCASSALPLGSPGGTCKPNRLQGGHRWKKQIKWGILTICHGILCQEISIFLVMTNIAMENGPFIDGLPIKHGDFPWWFSRDHVGSYENKWRSYGIAQEWDAKPTSWIRDIGIILEVPSGYD